MKSHLTLVPTRGMTREDWLTYRMTGIGGSETGSILGLDDYKCAGELFEQKIGLRPTWDRDSMARFMGRMSEDLLAKLWQYWDGSEESMMANGAADRIVRRCRRVNAYVRNPAYPWLFISLDRVIQKDPRGEGILEIKNIGQWEASKWVGNLPPKHITQVTTYMGVAEIAWSEMAVWQDGRRAEVYPLDVNEGIWQEVVVRTKAFWDKVLEGRRYVNELYEAQRTYNQRRVDECQAAIDALTPEPDGSPAWADFLSEKYKRPALALRKGTLQEYELALQHLLNQRDLKALQESGRQFESQLKLAMGTSEALDFGPAGRLYWSARNDGKRIFSNKLSPVDGG
jgi:putative phage-type endonuclease